MKIPLKTVLINIGLISSVILAVIFTYLALTKTGKKQRAECVASTYESIQRNNNEYHGDHERLQKDFNDPDNFSTVRSILARMHTVPTAHMDTGTCRKLCEVKIQPKQKYSNQGFSNPVSVGRRNEEDLPVNDAFMQASMLCEGAGSSRKFDSCMMFITSISGDSDDPD